MPVFFLFFSLFPVAAQNIPRPEYPQPQFQREQWLNLNGSWEFEFDDENRGLSEQWAAGARKFSRKILVPFAFETKMSGIGDASFHPWIWYRRTLELPGAWKGKRVLLHFGAVDYRAMVWVNGRLAGQHEGGSVPFRFDITDLLAAGPNTITVRAEDPPTDRFIPRGKQYWQPQSRGIFYTRTSGIWQTVWLEAVGESYLDKVRITPSMNGAVRFDAKIQRAKEGLTFHAIIRFEKALVASGQVSADGARASLALVVVDPRLWDPARPNLYDVTFELRDQDKVLDRVQSYYGYRQVTAENGRVYLNGRPIYLKMVLDQGYWPESTLTAPSDEALQYDIRVTKEMGFNGARKHQKVEDPRYLYWADKLGLLVSGEMANAYLFDEDYVARFTREWIEAVERDYNHPSIILWTPMNESWGTPNARDPQQQHHLRANYYLTKSLDPTRLVIDNDGWEHTDTTDLMSIHDYARTGELLFEKYKDLGKPGTPFPSNARTAILPGYTYNQSPIFLSEFGGIAYVAPGSKVPPDAWGYAGVEPDQKAALARMKGLWEAIARIPQIVGICYTQLTDVEQEINGLLTYDRKPKFEAKDVRALNDLLR
ncbi:MAG: glycoside hydrolase family 2 [Bryobacteraceae bacterium]|nr:glycoside hydrolase family 2 [Bryobacteraceae bacterium]MDW8380115.1 glycoside hydrolase family 2 TIM barrel-domain containing protein [Bryobacterales bacterium]